MKQKYLKIALKRFDFCPQNKSEIKFQIIPPRQNVIQLLQMFRIGVETVAGIHLPVGNAWVCFFVKELIKLKRILNFFTEKW